MKIIHFLLLAQATVVFIVLIFLFMNAFLGNHDDGNEISTHMENGYLPSTSIDASNLPKITILYLAIFVGEVILVIKILG